MSKETNKEIDELIRTNVGVGGGKDKKPFVSDHTGYGEGGENFEHDNTGSMMNYSGVADDVAEAQKEHQDWQEGYDY